MSLSPFEHPFLSGLFADPELAAYFSAPAEIAAMVRFETALAAVQAEAGVIPDEAAAAIAELEESFRPDLALLAAGTGRDGVVAPDLVAQMRAALPEAARTHLHVGATSQDVIDTGLVLRLVPVLGVFEARLAEAIETLSRLAERFGDRQLMGRTRMQDALPITAADRLADWRLPLERHLARLGQLRPRLLVVQYGGAVGTLEKLGEAGPDLVERLAARLGLGAPQKAWHSQRDGIAEFASWLALVAGSLGKIGQDVALLAQNADPQIALSGGGGSSAMPHKSNPVAAEVLVALARHNATLSGGMAQALVHEQERSGAAWTLEWLILPQMVLTAGSALLVARRLLGSVVSIGR